MRWCPKTPTKMWNEFHFILCDFQIVFFLLFLLFVCCSVCVFFLLFSSICGALLVYQPFISFSVGVNCVSAGLNGELFFSAHIFIKRHHHPLRYFEIHSTFLFSLSFSHFCFHFFLLTLSSCFRYVWCVCVSRTFFRCVSDGSSSS